MNPLLALIIAEIVKQAPVLALELAQLFSQPEVTPADWDRLKARYAGRRYEDYAPPAAPENPGAR